MPGFDVRVGPQGHLQVSRKSELFWFQGYLGQTNEIAEDWIDTGDSVREVDGVYFYEARSDDLIKSSGYRISPHEVESVLLSHHGVLEAGVVGIPDAERGKRIVACVVLDKAAPPVTDDELKLLVREKLGKHISVKTILTLDALPKTESGKVKRRELVAKFT